MLDELKNESPAGFKLPKRVILQDKSGQWILKRSLNRKGSFEVALTSGEMATKILPPQV